MQRLLHNSPSKGASRFAGVRDARCSPTFRTGACRPIVRQLFVCQASLSEGVHEDADCDRESACSLDPQPTPSTSGSDVDNTPLPSTPSTPPSTSHPEVMSAKDGLFWPPFNSLNPPPGWVKMLLPNPNPPPPQTSSRNSIMGSISSSLDCLSAASPSSFSQDTWSLTSDEVSMPAASNTPTSEDETLYVPRKEMWTLTDQPGVDMFLAGPAVWGKLPQVFVILFGVGERDTEGIYSLRAFGDDGLPQETIIAFETEEDAQQYAGLLEATMDHTPNVCSIPPRELMDFCVEQGYSCRLEPHGSLLIPPDYNVGVTDWERSLRLREGRWMVLEEEPTLSKPHLHAKGGQVQVANVQTKVPGVNYHSTLARYTGLSDTELETIRAKLERLLP